MVTQVERLAALEAQVGYVREDIGEIKTTLKALHESTLKRQGADGARSRMVSWLKAALVPLTAAVSGAGASFLQGHH